MKTTKQTNMLKKISRRFVLALVLLPIFSSIHAQKFTASVSETFKGQLSNQVFKWDNNIIMAEETGNKMQFAFSFKLSKVKYGVKLYRYDGAMKLVKENQLFNGERKAGPFPSSVKVINNIPYLIYPEYQEGANSIKIMAAAIEPEALTIQDPKELLQLDIEKIGLFKAGELLDKFKLSLELSPDKSKVLCFWSSGLDNDYYISVLDADLKPIWNKKETVLTASKIKVGSTAVDNNGVVYLSYKTDGDKDEYSSHIAVCQQGKRPKDMEIRLPDGNRPYQALVVASKTGKVHVAGTYAGASDFLAGVFYQSLSADLRLSKPQLTAFSETLVKHLDKEDPGSWASSKAKKYGLVHLDMQGYEMEDGSLSMIGEFRGRQFSGSGHSFILSGSMLNLHFDDKNTTIGYIPKYRVSAGSTVGDSYYAFPYKNALLVFYNDHEENLKPDVWDKFSQSNNYRKSVLAVASMDSEGKIKREKVMDLSDDSFLPIGEAMIPLAENSLLVPISKIKKLGGVTEESKWGAITID